MKILFICTGNVSRSFLAEMLFKNEIRQHKIENVTVSSAGTAAFAGEPADPEMVKYLSKNRIPVEEHEAKPVTEAVLDNADIILVMEKWHSEILERRYPKIKDKIGHLGQYISPDQVYDDIIDPYNKSSYHYRLAQSQITLAVRALSKSLLSEK